MSKKNNSRSSKKCQICNKNAVGFHYGAYVCEACKKFFVRHASGVCRLYGSCQEKGKCDLNIDGRGKCQHCRYKRCSEIGMNIDSKSSDYDLTAIPCQVCGAKSSGLHFGCITCEGCKGFFRRMIKFKNSLVCFNENKCKLDLKNRSSCKSCRMNRCLVVGMSRKGIRIGRHTNSLKFTCLSMLKAENSSNVMNDSQNENQEISSPKSNNIDNSSDSEIGIKVEKTIEDFVENNDEIKNENEMIVDSVKNEDENVNENQSENEHQNDNQDDSEDENNNEKSVVFTFEEKVNESDCIRNEVTSFTDLTNETSPNSSIESSSEDCSCFVTNLETIKLDVPTVSDCQFSNNYTTIVEEEENLLKLNTSSIQSYLSTASVFLSQNKLGIYFRRIKNLISSKDSLEKVWSIMMDHFVYHSQFIVKFAKLMPGFLRLSLNDKKIIIKDALYPMILLELSQDYSEVKNDIHFNYFDFSASDRQIILSYFPEFTEFSLHVKKTGLLSHTLALDTLELTLLCGIMMFYNYRNLDNWVFGKSMILLYQQYLILYFQSHLNLSSIEISIRQQKCQEFIMHLNEMNLQHQKIIIDFCNVHTELQYPDLYIEVFNH